MPCQMVNTKKVTRRTLAFADIGALVAELDRIEAAHGRGTLRTTGNWTPGQNLQHCSRLFVCALDGWPGRAPWFVRVLGTLLFKRMVLSGRTLPPGFPIPKDAAHLLPDPDCSFATGMAAMRRVVARLNAGERMLKPSPVFGAMTHEQWTRACLGHAQLHLGFLWLE